MQIHHIQLLQKNGHPTWSSANCFLKNAAYHGHPTIRFHGQEFMANILQPKEISQLRPLKNMTSLFFLRGQSPFQGGKLFNKNLRAVTTKHGKPQQLLKKMCWSKPGGILDYPNRSFSRFRNLSG